MGGRHVNPLVGLRFRPTASKATAWKYEGVDPVFIYDSQFQIVVERRRRYRFPLNIAVRRHHQPPCLILFSGNVQSRLPDNRSTTMAKCGTDSLSQRIWCLVTSATPVKTMGMVCLGGRCPLLTGEARVRSGSCLLGNPRLGRTALWRPRNLRPAWTALLGGALCYRIRR